MNNFYTYIHYRLDNFQPFYVGKGSGKRAAEKRRKNIFWNNIVNKHGFFVSIVQENLSESDAFKKEKELIFKLRHFGFNLANMTDGGEGLSDPTGVISQKISTTLRNKTNEIKEQNLSKYGVDWFSKTESFKESMRSYWKNSGVVSPFFLCDREKHKEKMNSKETKDKHKNSCLKAFGVDHQLKSPEIKEKVKNTCLKKYGVDNYAKSKEFRENASRNNPMFLEENIQKWKIGYDLSHSKRLESLRNRPIGTCPHCGKVGKMMGGMMQYHFDNCKHKVNDGT